MSVFLKKHSIKSHFHSFLKTDFIYIPVGKQVLIFCFMVKVPVNFALVNVPFYSPEKHKTKTSHWIQRGQII